jgi:UbiD family decarboxylase
MTAKRDSISGGRWSRDLRGWLECLEAENELKVVQSAVTPDGEVQEIARQMSARQGPAILFTNVVGHEETWCSKLFVGALNTFGKVSLALGLPKETPLPVTLEKMRETLRNPVQPILVDTGPVKENIISSGIDLNQIPVPWWHPQDGGRYINMWHGVVTRDPESDEYNLGCYRGHIVDKDKIVSLLVRSQHWGRQFEKYRERGEDMPVAFVYGIHPAMMIAAGSPVTTCGAWGEYEWIGAMMGEPLPVVKCETVDLHVPASAEIVIEGHILRDPVTYAMEGPLKEASGRYSEPAMMPVMKVGCITHRDDPIYTGSASGLAPVLEEQLVTIAAGTTAILKNHLQNAGIPILDLTLAPFFAVSIKKMWEGHPMQVAYTLLGHKSSNLPVKMLVVVEEDVNIYDPVEINRAINNNVDPAEDVHVLPVNNLIFDVATSKENSNIEAHGGVLGSKLFIDATAKWRRHPRQERWGGARIAPVEPPPSEDVEKVKNRWNEYGFGEY